MLFQRLFGFNPKLNLLEKKHSNCNHKIEYDHEIMEMTSTSSEFLFSLTQKSYSHHQNF